MSSKFALISPEETIRNPDGEIIGFRIVEVAEIKFSVAAPLYWVDLSADLDPSMYCWGMTNSPIEIPIAQEVAETPALSSTSQSLDPFVTYMRLEQYESAASHLATVSDVYGIERLIQDAKGVVNGVAERARSVYVTKYPGQITVYAEKEKSARDYLTAESPINADYPLLSHEAGVLGISLQELAVLIVGMADAWKEVAGRIEAIRIRNNHLISSATSNEGVLTALMSAIDELNAV